MTAKTSETVKQPSGHKVPTLANADLFCEQLNVNIEIREDDTWVAFDSLNACSDESVSDYLSNLKTAHPKAKFRALNRATGRLVDFI